MPRATAAVQQARAFLPTALVALATFGLAFNDGTFAAPDRYAVAIAIWWGLLLGVAFAVWPAARIPRPALVSAGLLAAFCALTAASIGWSTGSEIAFEEVNRVTAYIGAFLAAVAIGTRQNVARLLDGLALGIVAIGLLALAARLFPNWIDAARPEGVFAGDPRPSWPVGYWNALAVLMALGLPLLLRLAVASPRPLIRGLAIAPIPALAALVYLTASRSGVATAALAVIILLGLTSERVRTLVAGVLAAIASVGAVVLLASQSAIADNPYSSPDATDEGTLVAIGILAICVALGCVHALLSSRPLRLPAMARLSRRTALVLAAGAALVIAGGVAAADPSERFEEFKEPPAPLGSSAAEEGGFTGSASSGRWQLWSAAVDEWEENPVIGGGAGSYEAWWAEHADIEYFARSAHSLYLDALAELGPGGLILLLGLLAVAAIAAWRRVAAARRDEQATIASVAAVVAGFAVAVGVDWTWDLTALPIVGLFALGLLTGAATAPYAPEPGGGRGLRWHLRLAFAVVALAVVAAQTIPLMSQTNLQDSREAAARGDTEQAMEDAEDAREWQPWAASPYVQIALVREQELDIDGAREAIADAIDRYSRDWRLWLVSWRIETTGGDEVAARASFDRALELNPRSVLLESLNPYD